MNISEKSDLIFKHEKQFAYNLAYKVISQSEMQMWFILFPFAFVFYFIQKKRVVKQRQEFVEKYMEETRYVLHKILKINYKYSFSFDNLPDEAKKIHKKLINIRIKHYNKLLKKMDNSYIIDKNNIDIFIRLTYNLNEYRKFIININHIEEKLYEILDKHISNNNNFSKTIHKMREWSTELRIMSIAKIFK